MDNTYQEGCKAFINTTYFLCNTLLGNQGICFFTRQLSRKALRKGPQVNSGKLSATGFLTIDNHY